MESNHMSSSTLPWVQPVDGDTCAALSRELWGMLSASRVELSVVDFCGYITGATLAFQRAYAGAEWGETHDWMEATETFLAGYMLDYPIRELESAWERQAGPLPIAPLPVTSAVYAVDDRATVEAALIDDMCDRAGRELAALLQGEGIPCVHYGDGDLVVLWGVVSAELRLHVCGSIAPLVDVFLVVPESEGDYDTVAEDLTLAAAVEAVRGIIAQVHGV
jgi:hypothetical protein